MLIELWEKLRGYDKWVETQAKIEQSQMREVRHTNRDGSVSYTYSSSDVLTWVDAQGVTRSADINVDDQSPLYQFVGGESVTIRYNPRDPTRFYYRDLLRSRVHFFFRILLFGVVLSTFILLAVCFRIFFGR